ncbi:TB2/DP1, HVA22 family-domain-containing protein [Sparassis latifolia]
MLLNFALRVVSASAAFLYPGYASYKTLSQRPASEADLERWLMYWSVLGCIVAVEYVAEWLVSWLPLYYTMKTAFLLYLALPQTAGSAYLYRVYLRPFFASHEDGIDNALAQLKAYVYQTLQNLLRRAWEHVSTTLRQMPTPGNEAPLAEAAAAQTVATPSLGDPSSGPMQLAQGLWRSYGPGILASGAVFLRQAQNSVAQAATSSAHAQGVEERRRHVRDELATEHTPGVSGYDVEPISSPESGPGELIPPANNDSRHSSDASLRERAGGNNKSNFEEVEVPSDVEGDEGGGHGVEKPSQVRRTSWFAWGTSVTSGKGDERVKSD